MRKPDWMTNIKLFIKHKSWFLVAGWTANKGDELHWDYEYARSREEWERILNDLKKSEWNINNVPDAELISEKKLIGYGVADASKEWTKN